MSFHRERRRYPRFELSQILVYRWGMTEVTVRTVNLSLGGVKIQTDSPMPADRKLEIILLLDREAVRLVGKTIWANPLPYRKFDIGISFETISHNSFERIDRFLKGSTQGDKPPKREKALGQSGRDEYDAHFGFLDSVKAECDKVDTGVIFLIDREMFYAKFWGKPTKLASALKRLLGKDFRNKDVRELMYALSIGSRKSLKFPRELIRSDFVEILKPRTSEEDMKEWERIFSEIALELDKK